MELDLLLAVAPPSLTVIACLFLIFKYIQQHKKNLGFSLITILAVSDLIYSINTLVSIFWNAESYGRIALGILFFSIYFSIGWASAIAFLVYQSLADKNFDSKKQTARTFIGTFLLSCLCAFYWNASNLEMQFYIVLFIPLALSLVLTLVFYIKSIIILRGQQEYSLKSTKSYIKSLACYSFVQLFTYGPFILFLFFSGFYTFEREWAALFIVVAQNLSNLSGFFSALIFLCQGSSNYNKPLINQNDDENDLTQDLI